MTLSESVCTCAEIRAHGAAHWTDLVGLCPKLKMSETSRKNLFSDMKGGCRDVTS